MCSTRQLRFHQRRLRLLWRSNIALRIGVLGAAALLTVYLLGSSLLFPARAAPPVPEAHVVQRVAPGAPPPPPQLLKPAGEPVPAEEVPAAPPAAAAAPAAVESNTEGADSAPEEPAAAAAVEAPPSRLRRQATDESQRPRLVVLYTEDGKINTGVWPSWGLDSFPSQSFLNWAAAGVAVQKACPVQCAFTHDQGRIAEADAVIVESINHPKFGLADIPMQWPDRPRDNARASQGAGSEAEAAGVPLPPRLPAIGLFYYEPESFYPHFALSAPDVRERIDFALTPSPAAHLPITLICPWGRQVADFLAPAPPKSAFLAYFSEHGVAPAHAAAVDQLFEAAAPETSAGRGIHAFSHRRNRDLPPEAGGEPYALSNRLTFVSGYRFLLVTDPVSEEGFLNPEWSQAFLAGAVPVYLGAPHIAAYSPGPRSFVDGTAFASGAELYAFLSSFDPVGEAARAGEATRQRLAAEGADEATIEAAVAAASEAAAAQADAAYAHFFDWKEGARLAYAADEGHGEGALGTGEGVAPALPPEQAAEQAAAVAAWPLPSVGAPAEENPTELAQLSQASWRRFRRLLDSCVHYSECRVCRLLHAIT